MDYPFNPTEGAAGRRSPTSATPTRPMVPLTGNNAWAQALGPTHFSWMFQTTRPRACPRSSRPTWVRLPHQPGDLVLGHAGRGGQDRALSVHRRLRLHARREQPFRRRAAARRHRPGRPAAAAPGGHQIPGAVLGARRFRAAPAGGRYPRGEARDFTDICTELARRCGILEKYNAAINRGTCGVKPLTAPRRLSLDPGVAHGQRRHLGRRLPGRQRRAHRRRRGATPDWWKENGLNAALPARAVVPVPDRGRARPALRDALPGAPQAHRRAARPPPARGRHALVGQAARGYQALPPREGFPRLWEASVAKAGGEAADYPFWLVTARSMQYAWGGNVGVQMIREVAGNVSGHGGVVMNPRARRAPPGRRRPGRDRHAAPRHQATWCCARAYAPTRCCSSASSTTGSRRWPRTSACPA